MERMPAVESRSVPVASPWDCAGPLPDAAAAGTWLYAGLAVAGDVAGAVAGAWGVDVPWQAEKSSLGAPTASQPTPRLVVDAPRPKPYPQEIGLTETFFGSRCEPDLSFALPDVKEQDFARDARASVTVVPGPKEPEEPGLAAALKRLRRDYPALHQHRVSRAQQPGTYCIAGRVLEVYLRPAEGEEDVVMVRDGPLRQPFVDYVFDTGRNEEFEVVVSSSALHSVPDRMRLPVQELEPSADRLVSMRRAKEQAKQREEHAAKLVRTGSV